MPSEKLGHMGSFFAYFRRSSVLIRAHPFSSSLIRANLRSSALIRAFPRSSMLLRDAYMCSSVTPAAPERSQSVSSAAFRRKP